MRFRYILLLLFVFEISGLYADTIEVKGRFTLTDGNMPPVIVLHSYTSDFTDIPAQVIDGAFTLRVPIPAPIQYNLRFGNTSYDVMLSPREKETFISINISNDRLKDIEIKGSDENSAYRQLMGIANLYDEKLRKHFVDCEKEENCQKDLRDILLDYKDDLTAIQSKYKGTYAADVLCKMKMPVISKDEKNTASEYRSAYFESVPYADPYILANSYYKEMIENYVDFVMPPSYSQEEAFIKDLMSRAKADQKVFSRTASILLESLLRKSREKMLGMFITWYGENKAAVNNPVMETKINNLSKVMPGKLFTDITRKDVAGSDRSLKDVVDSSKATLLLFWSSDCSHCREEMPYIQEMYGKYHKKGFDVYAVSLEHQMDKWKAYIQEKGLIWTNVPNIQGSGSNPAMEYVVMLTPTLVLIDKNGIILHRFVPKNKLEKYIQEALR